MDDVIICNEYIIPAPKPAMLGELCLCFEHDFPIQEVSEILGVQATNCGRQNDMKINPITGKKNPGYWEYTTPKTQDYDCGCVIDMLHSFISLHKKQLLKVKQCYPCDVIIRIYIWAYEGVDCPAILLKSQILADSILLDAYIDVIVEK